MDLMWVLVINSKSNWHRKSDIGMLVFNRHDLGISSMLIVLGAMLFLIAFSVSARGIYQTDQDFLTETFNNSIPKSKVVWVKGDLKQEVSDILGHPYLGLRIRYWPQQTETAWILEEIGKTEPITFGVVIIDDKVASIRVLEFRESRGAEIRHPVFTKQFEGASLKGQQLDRTIDGISGATLSVRAINAVARLALYLHAKVAPLD